VNLLKALPVIAAVLLIACSHFNPTPSLFNELIEENNQTVALYAACSTEGAYEPDKEGCNPEALKIQVLDTMFLAKDFISGDIKQPQGYDIYLATAMVYFRIGERNRDEYSEAEKIARQFFEVQKASSGKSINTARYYWVIMTTAHTSWQFYNEPETLDGDRKVTLLLCLEQGHLAVKEEALDPPRQVMLIQATRILMMIVEMIP